MDADGAARIIALELKRLRRATGKASAKAVALADQAITDLRETYKRRPSFLAALDRANMP